MADTREWKRLRIPAHESTTLDFETICLDGRIVQVLKPTADGWYKVRSLDGYVTQVNGKWLHDVPEREKPPPKCTCPRSHNCRCGAFRAEQTRRGLRWCKWTKLWYDPSA